MANTRYTCESKNFKNCDQPKQDFSITGFNGVLCKTCWGVVSYVKIEEPKKIRCTKKQIAEATVAKELTQDEAIMKVAALNTDAPLAELTKIKAPEATDVKEKAQEERPVSVADIVLEKVALIKEMESKKFPAVDIMLELKSKFRLKNASAGAFLKEYRANNAPKVVAVAEAVPETIPQSLTEKVIKERESSPIKPPVAQSRIIPKTQKSFPIIKFETDETDRSYKMSLVTEDGLEFMFRRTPQVEKYERAKLNPNRFIGISILLEFSEVDESDIPLNPVFAGIDRLAKDREQLTLSFYNQ